jgi:DNA-directed RNA polymerase alpha subunit
MKNAKTNAVSDIARLAKYFSEKELLALELRFEKYRSLQNIGEELGVTRERVRQILTLATRKAIRALIESDRAADVYEAERRAPDAEAIECLCLSARSYNCLKRGGVGRIDDLLKVKPERFKRFISFGAVSQREVIAKMRERGFEAWAKKTEEYITKKRKDETQAAV